ISKRDWSSDVCSSDLGSTGLLWGADVLTGFFAEKLHTHTIANVTGLQAALNSKEASFTKNGAFNKDFGTASGTVAEGNDSRFHSHSNKTVLDGITSAKVTSWDGKLNVGTADGRYLRLNNSTNQKIVGPVEFSGDVKVPDTELPQGVVNLQVATTVANNAREEAKTWVEEQGYLTRVDSTMLLHGDEADLRNE